MITLLNVAKALMISVVGGLVVYLFTKKRAQLTYYFSDQTDFSQKSDGHSERITFQNLTIKNSGNNTATDVNVILDGSFLQKNKIEHDIKTIEQHEKIIDERNNVCIMYKRMLPKDTFTVSFLQRGGNPIIINKEVIISARCNETVAIDEKSFVSSREWIKFVFLLGVLAVAIYFMVNSLIKEKRQTEPRSRIAFSIDKTVVAKGDTINISTYIQNAEKQVITGVWWHINTSTFGLYEVDSMTRKDLNPGGFYRQAILDIDHSDVRYGIVIVPSNIPAGKYYFSATCFYDVGGVQKQKTIKNIIDVQ